MKRVLTTDEVAEILRLHPTTVRRRAESGDIPALRIGRVWRFPARWIEKYITAIEQADEDTP